MILHYLKVAVRNLLKYKTQSVISILGLAVGFVCFALANLWTRYEMTYDSHLEGSERTYVLYTKSVFSKYGYDLRSAYPMSTSLKETFPEVEATCAFNYWGKSDVKTEEGIKHEARMLLADSCYMDMFHIRIAEGSDEFLYTDGKIAVTRDFARRVFGSTGVLGKKIIDPNDKPHTICAVLEGTTPHSNFSFDYWGEGAYFRKFYNDWSNVAYTTLIKLRKGTDSDEFLRKMQECEAPVPTDWNEKRVFKDYMLMPLTEYHYADFNEEKSIRFNYLIMFSTIGVLVILCSLFNYLSLFVVRVRMRLREIGLRKVYGATVGNMMGMFLMEYIPIILLSGMVGMMIIELVFPAFRKVSMVTTGMYAEPILYFAVVAIVSVLILLPVLWLSPKLTAKGTNNRFRKASIFFQLVISIFFLFCVSVIMKQVHYLKNTDIGWERKNIAAFEYLYPSDNTEAIVAKIEQFASVKEMLLGYDSGLLPKNMMMSIGIKDWEGKPEEAKDLNIEVMQIGKFFFDFYQLRLVEGRLWEAENHNVGHIDVIINESAVKAMGFVDPIGKEFMSIDKHPFHVIGVVKDFHTGPPTVPVQPLIFVGDSELEYEVSTGGCIVLKYHPGQWKELKAKVDELFASEYPEVKYNLLNVEDVYAQYLEAEDLLMKLLGVVSVVCMLICSFGVFSLVSLTCRQRQKEIAIRKINGATVKDILQIFAWEYFILLTASSLVAFSAGYAVMKHWLESYTLQTAISAWLFIALYLAIALIITFCIGYRVWKAANENPADVVKSE